MNNEENNFSERKTPNIKVETYAQDIAKVISSSKGATIKEIIENAERKEEELYKVSPESNFNKSLSAISGLFLVLGCSIIAFIFLFKEDITQTQEQKPFSSFIFLDKTEFKDVTNLDKDDIVSVFLNESKNTELKKDDIEGIFLTENGDIVGLEKFMGLIESSFDFTRVSFVNDDFIAGFVNKDQKDFFLLIKMRSFPDIFFGLKYWEKKMFSELYPFFNLEINSENSYLLTKEFEDGIVQNKNARILRDQEGNIVLMYIYPNDNFVIITNTEDSASEIMLRLFQGRVKR